MNKTFIKKLKIIQEEGVNYIGMYSEPSATPSRKLKTRKSLKILGKVVIVISSILLIIYIPILFHDYVNFKGLWRGTENYPLILIWLLSLFLICVYVLLLILVFAIFIRINDHIIKPIVKWIMK